MIITQICYEIKYIWYKELFSVIHNSTTKKGQIIRFLLCFPHISVSLVKFFLFTNTPTRATYINFFFWNNTESSCMHVALSRGRNKGRFSTSDGPHRSQMKVRWAQKSWWQAHILSITMGQAHYGPLEKYCICARLAGTCRIHGEASVRWPNSKKCNAEQLLVIRR